MKVVIIGGGAAGITTASNLRKYNKDIDITVISRDEYVSYSPCAIPYVLSEEIHSFDDIIMNSVKNYKEKNIRVLTKTEATSIDNESKIVKYNDGNEKSLKYDILVIATGGKPFVPLMEGVDLNGVFQIKNINDGLNVEKWVENSKSSIVAGAGLIGIEIAYGLKKRGVDVTIAEMQSQIIPRSFDQDMALIVENYLKKIGINIILGKAMEKIVGEDKVTGAVFDNKDMGADMVILATGVKAELDLANMAGCKTGRWGIKVNEHMETSVPDIYSVGDCVEVEDAILKCNTISPLGTTAVRQGKIAAKNILGYETDFNPVLNSMVSKVGKLEFGAVGLTTQFAEENNIKTVSARIKALTRARYYPGAQPIDIKMICDETGRIIGCQIIAPEKVGEKIDYMSLAISKKMTCFELSNMEFAYAPPISMVNDPLSVAAEEVIKKFKK